MNPEPRPEPQAVIVWLEKFPPATLEQVRRLFPQQSLPPKPPDDDVQPDAVVG